MFGALLSKRLSTALCGLRLRNIKERVYRMNVEHIVEQVCTNRLIDALRSSSNLYVIEVKF